MGKPKHKRTTQAERDEMNAVTRRAKKKFGLGQHRKGPPRQRPAGGWERAKAGMGEKKLVCRGCGRVEVVRTHEVMLAQAEGRKPACGGCGGALTEVGK